MVRPLKQLTIPRLEICAATLLYKLYKKDIVAINITVNLSYLWKDSLLYSLEYKVYQTNGRNFYATELLLFKQKKHQLHVDMGHLNPNHLIPFQEGLNIELSQHPYYGGRDHNDFHRRHPAGPQQSSTHTQTSWKSEICKLQV